MSQLSDLAAAMAPGTWANLPQNTSNFVNALFAANGNRIVYSVSGYWDPIHLVMQFVGQYHSEDAPAGIRHITYDAGSNSWSVEHNILPPYMSHGYDNGVLNPHNGEIYFRHYALGGGPDAKIYHTKPWGGPWSAAKQLGTTDYMQVTIGSTWWDGELAGAGAQGAWVVYNPGAFDSTAGELALFDPVANAWFSHHYGFGGKSHYDSFAEYSKVHNVAIFGGGGNAEDGVRVYRLNADNTITSLPNSPIPLGVYRGNVAADPVTGDFIIYGYGQMYSLNPLSGVYTNIKADRFPPDAVNDSGSQVTGANGDEVISFTIENYGVIGYVSCASTASGGGSFYLYKHAPSTAPVQHELGLVCV